MAESLEVKIPASNSKSSLLNREYISTASQQLGLVSTKSIGSIHQELEIAAAGFSSEWPSEGSKNVTAGFNYAGVISVLGGMLSHVLFGTLYCWGNFNSYTPKHMKNFNGSWDPANSKKADTLQLLALTIVAQAIAMPWGAPLAERIGPSAVTLLAGTLCAMGPFLASYMSSLLPFCFCYSGVLGAGIGIGYTVPLVCGYKHFPESKGVVSGLILGAFGLGGFIFNNVGTALFNPNGFGADPATKLYPDSVTDGFASRLRILAIVYFAIGLVAAPMVRMPKQDIRTVGPACAVIGVPVFKAAIMPTFWIMWFVIVLGAQGGLYTSSSYKSIALDTEGLRDDTFLGTVGALGSLANGLARPVWGMLYDRIGFQKSWIIAATIQGFVCFAFPIGKTSHVSFASCVVFSYAALAGCFTLAPAEAYRVFSNASCYGALYSSFAVAGVFGVKLANAVAEVFAVDSGTLTPIVATNISSNITSNTTYGVTASPSLDDTSFRFLSLMAFLSVLTVQVHGCVMRRWTI